MAREPHDRFGRTFGRGAANGRGAIDSDGAPETRRRSDTARHSLVVFGHVVITVLLFAAIIGDIGFFYGSKAFNAPGPLAVEKSVVIARGSGTTDIADTLEQQGVIKNALLFTSASKVLRTSSDLKAGEYVFSPGISMREVMRLLVEGKGIQHAVTIPEGFTSQMIVDRLREDPVLVGDITVIPREGALLPDTYVYERGATRQQILARMEAAQKKLVDQIWKQRSAQLTLKSSVELVTLASIVEKETGKADERPRVASVFINRLAKNMRLQSDPTIIYGMVGGAGKLDRPLTRADIEAPTPYNTYTINGLPPGPIANPGRAAMEAVANPSQTKDLYFVADGTGGHAFAETLEQHNRNVVKWRQVQPPSVPLVPSPVAPSPVAPSPVAPSPVAPTPVPPGAPAPTAPTPVTPGPATPVPPPVPGSGALVPPAPGVPRAMQAADNRPATRGFVDPVQNTSRDPLLNQTFDLNSPQTVPKVD